MTPDEYCQQKAAQSGSSFYYSFLFLPPERRRAITALYAFCREVDDIVDECTDVGVARTKLAWWRDQVAAIYDDAPASSKQGPPWGSDPEDAHRAGIDAPMAGSTVASPQVGPLLHAPAHPLRPAERGADSSSLP